MTRCGPCGRFFSRYVCSAHTHLECDCPKCQGYCLCNNDDYMTGRNDGPTPGELLAQAQDELAEDDKREQDTFIEDSLNDYDR